MTEQNCPLCGEKLKHSMDFIGDRYYCLNTNCMDIIMRKSDLNKLISQISRIKQEAKQEFCEDLEMSIDLCKNKACGMLHYVFTKRSLDDIKKKHGVE
jgi:hypothetical protein